MPSCLVPRSPPGGGIVHSNKGAPDASSAIGILSTASSRTAEVLIAMKPLPPDFCSLFKNPEQLKQRHAGSIQTLWSHLRCGLRKLLRRHLPPFARPAVRLPEAMLDSAK